MNEREALSSAEQVFVELFSEPNTRRICTEFLSASVLLAHSCAPSRWGITLFPDAVRLNVGMIEVITLRPGGVHVVVDFDSIPTGLTQHTEVSMTAAPLYRSVPTSVGCDFPSQLSSVILPVIRASHEALVRRAAATPRNPAVRASYSPSVTAFLSLGSASPIPQPSYYEVEPPQTAA